MNTDLISRADAEALFRTARSKLNPSDYKTADEFNTRDLMLLNAEQMIHLLPFVNPQPCEDAISRQDAIDFMRKPLSAACAIEYLENAPSVQPIRPKGSWEHGALVCTEYEGREVVGRKYAYWYCGECKLSIERGEKPNYNYCPNCGADMRESEEQA